MHKVYVLLFSVCLSSCIESAKKGITQNVVMQNVTLTEVEEDEGEVINRNSVIVIYPNAVPPMDLQLDENTKRVYEVNDKYPAELIQLCKKCDSSHLGRYEFSEVKKLFYKTSDNKIDSIGVSGNENQYRIYFFDKRKRFKRVSLNDWQNEWPTFFN